MAAEPQGEERRHAMKYKKLVMKTKRRTTPALVQWQKCCFLWLLLLLMGCDRRDLTYYEVAEITLTVDWSQSGLDNMDDAAHGATAVFYPIDSGEPKIFLMGNYSREVVRLQQGVYNVILFNRSFTDFSHIAFRGNERYDMLEAYSKNTETRLEEMTDTRVVTASPEKLAAATVEGFEVTEDMLGNYSQTTFGRSASTEATDDERCTLHFVPQKRTREVVAVIRVEGLNNVRSAKCSLQGISESVFLATGKTSGRSVTQEFSLSHPVFDEGSPFNGTLTGKFNVFGIDFTENHRLHLEAQLVDGKTVFADSYDDVKVTEKDNGEGGVTVYVEVTTNKVPDVEPEGSSGSGFDVDVDGWGDEVNTDIPIE